MRQRERGRERERERERNREYVCEIEKKWKSVAYLCVCNVTFTITS